MIVDFHSHTTASDGSLAPADLVALMRARGVQIFSITDHDSLRAYDELDVQGARVVVGIEINTTWNGNDVHVLGYNVPRDEASPLTRTLAENRAFRRARVDRMVAGLNAAGYPITVDAVLAEAHGAHALGRPHVARALIRAGLTSNVETAFRDLLGRGKPGYAPSDHITPFDAVRLILESGGVPVLAHPGRLRDEAVMDELCAAGLVGLEVFYPRHDAIATARYRAYARAHGLVMTAGMDFHDRRYNPRGVGMEIDEVDITPFLERVL